MSTVQFKIVQAELLDSADLPLSFLEQAAATLAAGPIDFGDLYFERAEAESFYLEEGIIKAGSFDIDKGVGIRDPGRLQSGRLDCRRSQLPAGTHRRAA